MSTVTLEFPESPRNPEFFPNEGPCEVIPFPILERNRVYIDRTCFRADLSHGLVKSLVEPFHPGKELFSWMRMTTKSSASRNRYAAFSSRTSQESNSTIPAWRGINRSLKEEFQDEIQN